MPTDGSRAEEGRGAVTGEELRTWRQARGLSRRQLGDLLWVRERRTVLPDYVSGWEAGSRPLPRWLPSALAAIDGQALAGVDGAEA